ncbi:MAG: hypothetical protein COS99_03770 [Candidatus Omnitrophica bacterium CG07_land_8_20_14_0_80_42_15]|uniref:Uncharacterized protein n=1 Tax=Candidatus Aquitaenariimonas noxiae TaxID=1974741 RepID=A0A2J0KTC3_9BACT|nr:MAG: hypothetical protein COS99_03770 [Candidatus Omnitrophica bacterium CG07_land_8_20_14_0_80_42_15]
MSCPILNLFAKCSCSCGTICPFCIRLTMIVIAIAFGALVAWKPKKVIQIQISLYRPFNWKLEPISMEKEIRNTRVMGLVLLILGILSLIYILVR